MADLFQRDESVISRHIANVFEEGELDRRATVAEFATVQSEDPRRVERRIEYYNLEVIISVGYRVKSHRGTQFRIWATQRLREYLIKGFALDDQRLKQAGGGNYFDELLARSRNPMYMRDWIAKLDDFLRLSERDILTHAGAVSHDNALAKAELEYEKWRTQQAALPGPVEEHFDKAVEEIKQLEQAPPNLPKQRRKNRGKNGGCQ